MHALILHTPTESNISSVCSTLLPHCLCLSRSFCPPLSPLSFCMSLLLSPFLPHAECAEVSTEMQSLLYFCSPTHGSMNCWCTCLTREKIGNSVYALQFTVSPALVTRLHSFVLFPAIRLPHLPHTTYAIHLHT